MMELALVQSLIASQVWLTRRLDRFLPQDFQIDGNRDFIDNLVPQYLTANAVVYDVGGGKNPIIGGESKRRLGLKVVGLDIDAGELRAAPEGLYDEVVCADVGHYRGGADADLVICQALLEHVPDTGRALCALASILKPGGRALIFVPCRNAVYARLNLALPHDLKCRLLYGIFPEMRRDHGFPAYYDRCTPARLERLARKHGLVRERRRLYFQSNYFRFCFPLYAVWRAWMLFFRSLAGAEAAETFSVVLRKEPHE